ncbi:MAG: 30S ribosomal protein S6 [Candidatus Zambryskibacteria bacterium]|nr:30S ribosomal protein S6 [Candidatus Zambryskibacteria bacterium]
METENIMEKGDMLTVYEVSYLLLPSLALEQVPAKVTTLKKMLTSVGGQVISDENPILIDLAYPMTKVVQTIRHKCTMGYFGWIKFEVTKEGIETVKKNLDMDNEILRYLIVKTVRENTLLSGKMKLKFEDVRRQDVGYDSEIINVPVVEKEATPEEIDKSIDDLVIV